MIRLYVQEGQSVRDVAAALGCSKDAAHWAILIDVDSQASASLSLRIDRAGFRPSFADSILEGSVLADRLAVTPMTVYRLINQGKIWAIRIARLIRFDPAYIDAFLESVYARPEELREVNQKG